MKIRTITYFCNPKYPLDDRALQRAGEFLRQAKAAFEAGGYEVQSLRLASTPFPSLLGERGITSLPRMAQQFEAALQENGIGYGSMGPASPSMGQSYDLIPEAIAATKTIFFGGVAAEPRRGIDLHAIRRCAEVIARCGSIEANGFANLRFAALANVPPGSPFFPAAYHRGTQPAFALGTEAADLAVDAFSEAVKIEDGRRALVASIQEHATKLARIAGAVSRSLRASKGRAKPKPTRFLGIDFSLAPFPEEGRSLGAAFERLGVPRAGMHGSLAAAAILTEAVGRARFPRTGFTGLFLPVLEDAILARRAAEGTLEIKDVLLYAAVCGTGLDTIPLPGDTTADQIAALLLDLCALALRLDKPLTARLMPIPNKKAGDATGFDFEFFANSKVMRLDSAGLKGVLGGAEAFRLLRR